jgi:hypothetical protein
MGVLLILASMTVWAGNQRQPLKIKPGLWEVTKVVSAVDGMSIPAALFEKLTPDQRARLEERLKARSTETAKKTVTRDCLTPQRLTSGVPFDQEQKPCRRTVVSSSASRIEVRMSCPEKDGESKGILEIEALSAESVKGSFQSLAGDGGRSTNSTFIAKWVGASCGVEK